MSTHKVEVVRLGPVTKLENADSLGVVQVWGYTAIVRLGDIVEGDLAVYIEPDYVLPTPGENADVAARFAFLGDKRRVKARRLRGTWSQGLLVKAWGDMKEGDDVMELLSITRWDPPIQSHGRPGAQGTGGASESPHPSLAGLSKYDVESLRRHNKVFEHGELVYASEKIHGCFSRYSWRDDRLWAGSRTRWVKAPGTYVRDDGIEYEAHASVWWLAVQQNPWIEEWCRANPDCVLYGEVFGQVQDLKYGSKPGQIFFRAFDVLRKDWTYVDAEEFAKIIPDEHRAPDVYVGPCDFKLLEELSRGDSRIPGAKHLAEGVVVKPAKERRERSIGRVFAKLVSDRYLSRE